jgi:uncharacterized protein involved in exopolysaccharide biosynthesis
MSDDVKRQIEQLRKEKEVAHKQWSEMEGRYGYDHPLTGQHKAHAEDIGRRLRELERSIGW